MRFEFWFAYRQAYPKYMLACFFAVYIILFMHSCVSINKIPAFKHTRIIADVPFYAQKAYQCGPASLAGVMRHWGVNVTPDDIAKEIYSRSARGTLNIDMILYPQRKGLVAEQYSGDMADIRENIDSGYPLIVLVDYGFYVLQANHFMVIIGYNEHGVIVNSGKEKGKFIPEKDFMDIWERTKFWTLLIKPQHQMNSK